MSAYRCKVRKPDGSIVDGCGYEHTPASEEHYSRDGMTCPSCAVGFLRAVERPQIHGGPLVVQALHIDGYLPAGEAEVMRANVDAQIQAGACEPVAPHHGAERGRLLRGYITPRIKTLTTQAATYPDAHVDCALVRETIALLQSLLPVTPEQDKQAQTDMAAEHNARADYMGPEVRR